MRLALDQPEPGPLDPAPPIKDTGDARRVGGVYGGYGNRLAKVVTGTPWHEALTKALTEGFKARGIEAVGIADREINPAAPAVQTPLALGGAIRNFSTESRWTQSAHVSGILRLYDQAGRLLLEREEVVTDPELTQRLASTR